MDARRILRQHVMTDRLLGIDALPRAETVATPPHPAAPAPRSEPTPPPPLPPPAPAPARAPAAMEPLERADKIAVLQQLDETQVRGCTRCELHRHRTQTVFGEGDPDAPVMFIGEGPGQVEDRQGRPFVGPAGEMLDKWISAIGLTRDQVYIANAVKCRPPNNRTPLKPEVDACADYLLTQVRTVQPKVIVTVGGPATKLLLDTDDGITRLRGRWHAYNKVDPPIPVMPTFHPAFLLRSYSKDNRAKIWDDLQKVMQRLDELTG